MAGYYFITQFEKCLFKVHNCVLRMQSNLQLASEIEIQEKHFMETR